MSDTQKSTAEQYRDTAEEIRLVARRTRTPRSVFSYSTSRNVMNAWPRTPDGGFQIGPRHLSARGFRAGCWRIAEFKSFAPRRRRRRNNHLARAEIRCECPLSTCAV